MQLINPHSQNDSTLTLTLDNDREEEDEAYKVPHVHQVAPMLSSELSSPSFQEGILAGDEELRWSATMASSARGNRARGESESE